MDSRGAEEDAIRQVAKPLVCRASTGERSGRNKNVDARIIGADLLDQRHDCRKFPNGVQPDRTWRRPLERSGEESEAFTEMAPVSPAAQKPHCEVENDERKRDELYYTIRK